MTGFLEEHLYWYRATVLRAVDGDTLELDIDLGMRLHSTIRVRLLGIDTPERGDEGFSAAKEYVTKRAVGREVMIRTERSDSFDRWLAQVFVDGVDIGAELLDLGFAQKWVRRR
jgi:micrococcal nuclease